VWIDGSFLTAKTNPDDLDFVVIMPSDIYDSGTPEQRIFVDWLIDKADDPKKSFRCHSHVELMYEPDSPLGAPPSSFLGFVGAFYPIYVRGEALLTAHRSSEAAAEFQKILDHRGTVVGIQQAHWPICKWAERSCYPEIRQRQRLRIRISSPSGKGPTPTYRSSGKPERNTPVCGNSDSDHLAGSRGMLISTCKRTSREEAAT
jgi:hypothetical protein